MLRSYTKNCLLANGVDARYEMPEDDVGLPAALAAKAVAFPEQRALESSCTHNIVIFIKSRVALMGSVVMYTENTSLAS